MNPSSILMDYPSSHSQSNSNQPPLKPFIKGERRYPCGFPGCKWVFTRSNHVLRHHQRVHPGYKGTVSSISSNSTSNSRSLPSSNISDSKMVSKTINIPPPDTGVFKCDMPDCNESFKTPALLSRHKKYFHVMMSLKEQIGNSLVSSSMMSPDSLCSSSSLALSSMDQMQILNTLLLKTPALMSDSLVSLNEESSNFVCQLDSCNRSFTRRDHLKRHQLQSHVHPRNRALMNQMNNKAVILQEEDEETVSKKIKLSCETNETSAVILEEEEEATEQTKIPDEDEEEDEMDESSPLEPEVVLEVDESRVWDPVSHGSQSSFSKEDNDVSSSSFTEADTQDPRLQNMSLLYQQLLEKNRDKERNTPGNNCFSMNTKEECMDLTQNKPKTEFTASKMMQSMVSAVEYSPHHALHHPPPPPINLMERPFVCSFPGCKWSFKRQYHLDRHFLTHRTGSSDEPILSTKESPNREKTVHGTSLLSSIPIRRPTDYGVNFSSSAVDINSYLNEVQDLSRSKQKTNPVQEQSIPERNKNHLLNRTSANTLNIERQETANGNNMKNKGTRNTNEGIKVPQKGIFTCNYPGCGIKCQSQSSFEAHVYLTHVVMNPNRAERNRRNAAAAANRNFIAQQNKQSVNQQLKGNNFRQQNNQQSPATNIPAKKASFNLSSSQSLSLLASIASKNQRSNARPAVPDPVPPQKAMVSPEDQALQLYNFSLVNLMSAVQQQHQHQRREEESQTNTSSDQQMVCHSNQEAKRSSREYPSLCCVSV